ncbi:MAG: hypothetical protein HYX39_03335 [Bacteroidetes bacterium]|nr:hypothetical protein [Bacteroidota bacterium]
MKPVKIILAIVLGLPLCVLSQNVGIGTNTPQSKLHVSGAIRSDTLIGVGPRNLFAAPNGRIYDSLVMPSTLNWEINGNSNIGATNFLGTTNTNDVIFKANNSEAARIKPAGNLGIGTANPNASALIEMVSTSRGLMVSQMNTPQRLAIVSPANGLLVDDITAGVLMRFNGVRWLEVGGDPIGTVQAFMKSTAMTPLMPWGWVECNGQVLTDTESPYNGQTIPDLNNTKKFLRGDLTSGIIQAEDLGAHAHAGTTSAVGNHGHGGSTGSVNWDNGRVIPWDDNFAADVVNGPFGNATPPGGLPWDGLGKIGNMITTMTGELDHTHIINPDGAHSHTFTTTSTGGTETRPTNMSVVWIIRIK